MYLFAAWALLDFNFRFNTFSCRALIPSVGVVRPSDESAATDGLLVDFGSIGGVKVEAFVLTLGLLGRRPLADVNSGGVSETGVARSSTSIRSAIISCKLGRDTIEYFTS